MNVLDVCSPYWNFNEILNIDDFIPRSLKEINDLLNKLKYVTSIFLGSKSFYWDIFDLLSRVQNDLAGKVGSGRRSVDRFLRFKI